MQCAFPRVSTIVHHPLPYLVEGVHCVIFNLHLGSLPVPLPFCFEGGSPVCLGSPLFSGDPCSDLLHYNKYPESPK